jgi:hypothetical protein
MTHLTPPCCASPGTKLLDDLPEILLQEQPVLVDGSKEVAERFVGRIRENINAVTAALFSAYENEYSIFCPMTGCFEVFGLDFLVDGSSSQVHLLEVNPGPDFKQTGDRLKGVIAELWEDILRVTIDSGALFDIEDSNPSIDQDQRFRAAEDSGILRCLQLVYSKRWSVATIRGGMSLG